MMPGTYGFHLQSACLVIRKERHYSTEEDTGFDSSSHFSAPNQSRIHLLLLSRLADTPTPPRRPLPSHHREQHRLLLRRRRHRSQYRQNEARHRRRPHRKLLQSNPCALTSTQPHFPSHPITITKSQTPNPNPPLRTAPMHRQPLRRPHRRRQQPRRRLQSQRLPV